MKKATKIFVCKKTSKNFIWNGQVLVARDVNPLTTEMFSDII